MKKQRQSIIRKSKRYLFSSKTKNSFYQISVSYDNLSFLSQEKNFSLCITMLSWFRQKINLENCEVWNSWNPLWWILFTCWYHQIYFVRFFWKK